MLTAFAAQVADVVRSFRFIDALDIALVALVLFTFLSWLRRGSSPPAARRAFAVAGLVVVGYVVTRAFDLYLVTRLVEALALVSLVALVVVFQHELRRALNRMGSWSPFASQPIAPAPAAIDDLVEAVNHLAERRIGALIALKGRESWEDHVHGGVPLEGHMSQPLLYSLFHPDTPGHDGAVLLEGGRVTRFAAHLPLPRELPAASRYGGTRHAAALGLSERCDALVVVVSEERGTVSVAHERVLQELDAAGELAGWIDRFSRHGRRAPSRGWSPETLLTALASVGLALLAWIVFAYSPNTIVRTTEAPVEVRNMPDEWLLEEVEPDAAALTLSGRERAFESLDMNSLTISFDAERLREGVNDLPIDQDAVDLPGRLILSGAEPASVRVVARRLIAVRVPVEVPTLGSLPGDLILSDLQPQPAQVTLMVRPDGPEPDRLLTEPIDLGTIQASGPVQRALILPVGSRLGPEEQSQVVVQVDVQGSSAE